MSDRFHEIKIKGGLVVLSADEIHKLLLSDISLFKTALGRGKGITRERTQKQREGAKWTAHEGEKLDFIE